MTSGSATRSTAVDRVAAERAADEDRVFAALANATRREVLRLLREQGPQPVQALADHFAMRRPSLSEHLKVLREAGLVAEQRAGRQRIYRLQAGPLAEVQDWLHPYERFWRERLSGLRDLLDALPDAPPGAPLDDDRAGDAAREGACPKGEAPRPAREDAP